MKVLLCFNNLQLGSSHFHVFSEVHISSEISRVIPCRIVISACSSESSEHRLCGCCIDEVCTRLVDTYTPLHLHSTLYITYNKISLSPFASSSLYQLYSFSSRRSLISSVTSSSSSFLFLSSICSPSAFFFANKKEKSTSPQICKIFSFIYVTHAGCCNIPQ